MLTTERDERPGLYRTRFEHGCATWFTRLWRSPAGSVYVSDVAGAVHRRREAGAPWEVFELPAVLMGVWGVDDGCVFAWGGAREHDRMFRWDGRRWLEMPSPGGVVALHGLAPDLVLAVGRDGLLAQWDGHRWWTIAVPVRETLSGVWVAGSDELYASGQEGTLLEGSGWGWDVIARHAGPLHAVAKWRDELWLAAGSDGLLRRHGRTNRLAPATGSVRMATSLDARDRLVVGCRDEVAETADGVRWSVMASHALARARAGQEPLWRA